MSTCFLNVPDPDDQPFDDDEPNKPIPPGDRWCSLWAAREPGGPRRPCHPSIEGTADEWLLIAGAIEAGAARAFGRVAFAPQAGGGEFWSPRNSTGDRDHVRLTTADLVELVADIRARLAPPDRDLKPGNVAPTHPMAEDGSGPTTGPAPGSRPPGVPPADPARVDFAAVDPGLAAQPPGNADFYRARSLFMADRGHPYMTPAEQVVAEQEWEVVAEQEWAAMMMIEGPSTTAAQAVRLLEAMAAAKPGDSRPPGVPTSSPALTFRETPLDRRAVAAHFDEMAGCDGVTGKEREAFSYCAEFMRAEQVLDDAAQATRRPPPTCNGDQNGRVRTVADQPSRPVAWSRYRDGVFVGIFEGPTDPRTVHDPGPRFEFRPLVEATAPPAIPDSRPTTLDRDGIAPHIAQYRQRRASVPSDRVVVSGDGPPYVRGLGDTTGAARITCPSLDVAYVVHDAMVIADVLLDTPPAIPADLRALLVALVAADDEWHRPTASDDDLGSIEVKRDAIHDDIIAWTRAHAGER